VSTVPAAASFRYIESSALLAALLEHDAAALKALRADGRRVTSALTFAEGSRALIRARIAGRVTPDEERAALRALQTFERRCAVVAVTDAVLTRAGRPFPVEPIRTLDAIHLATAELLGETPQLVTLVTRDDRVRKNARALGYAVA
jgi:predicted nucleic acid-binding protein